jgi:heme oxygenase
MAAPDKAGARPPQRVTTLSQRLREHTQAAHRRAERSGVIREMIAGRIGRTAYCVYLRNLQPVYTAMEQRLERSRLGALADPRLYRGEALANDLRELVGPDWRHDLPMLPAGTSYRARVAAAAEAGLVAHAYVRYLGDLSGGRVLQRILSDALQLPPHQMTFYAFPAIADLDGFKTGMRAAIDRLAATVATDQVLDEALLAFELNIALAEASAAYRRIPILSDI